MVRRRKRIGKILLSILLIGLMVGGCGQKNVDTENGQDDMVLEQDEQTTEGSRKLAVLYSWPERETYDKVFNTSYNATLAVWSEECPCGSVRLGCKQSYTDHTAGASAARECPLGETAGKDNLVTEEYAVSLYCPSCGEKSLSLSTDSIWLYRAQMEVPHYHLDHQGTETYWYKLFVDYYGQKWAYGYKSQDGEMQLKDKIKLEKESEPMKKLVPILAEELL